MPVLSSPIFVADTKIIIGYIFVAPLNLNLGHNCQLATSINIILPKLATSVIKFHINFDVLTLPIKICKGWFSLSVVRLTLLRSEASDSFKPYDSVNQENRKFRRKC